MASRCGVAERQVGDISGNSDEWALASFDEGVARVSRIVVDAATCESDSLTRIRAVLAALLRFFDDEPVWARLLILERPAEPGAVVKRRQRALATLARALQQETAGAVLESGSSSPTRKLMAELVVGGVFSVLRGRLLEGSREPLIGLESSLLALVTGPYRGPDGRAEQRAEPHQADARQDQQGPRSGRSPIRATYRTTRVLSAIGAAPRLSNREIADAAGLSDEGQTSKLLRRLERRGLVENVGLGQAYGEANAWLLTAYGQRVLDATRHSLVPGAGAVTGRRVRGTR